MAVNTPAHVRKFLGDCTITEPDGTGAVASSDLYGMYIIWCERSGVEPGSVQSFSAAVRENGIETGRRRRERVFEGVHPTGPIPIQYILETDKVPGPNPNPFPFRG